MTSPTSVLLYGAGREARSSSHFLKKQFPGVKIHVFVDEGTADIAGATQIPAREFHQEIADHRYSMIVRSPGVSIYKPELQLAARHNIPVTTNLNLWARYRRADSRVIAITGTKGKSTTAKLVHTILSEAGFDSALAGNIGVPVLDLPPHEWVVLELSSFQCADMKLDPDIVGMTCLFPEHLDWHGDEQHYFSDKLNILRRHSPYRCALSPQIASLDLIPQPPCDLVDKLDQPSPAFRARLTRAVAESALKGEHNLQNAILAARLCQGAGASEQDILNGIRLFEPLPHRLQEMRFGSKLFVNDSIATNPEATRAAIRTYADRRLSVIVGGYDRDQDFSGLANCLRHAALNQIWFLPDSGHRIARMLKGADLTAHVRLARNLEDIFARLSADPDQFDVLLLSPGAPSFNQFRNYEQRGDTFLDLARKHFGSKRQL